MSLLIKTISTDSNVTPIPSEIQLQSFQYNSTARTISSPGSRYFYIFATLLSPSNSIQFQFTCLYSVASSTISIPANTYYYISPSYSTDYAFNISTFYLNTEQQAAIISPRVTNASGIGHNILTLSRTVFDFDFPTNN